MLDEVKVNLFSQLAYLDVPSQTGGRPTVGGISDYYGNDPTGAAYLKARFGSIAAEYEGWRSFFAEDVFNVRDWRVVNVMDHNRSRQSGFYACGYRSPEGDLIAAFRGSEMLGNRRYRNDYETDFALAYEDKTPQQRVAEIYLRSFADYKNCDYWLTGHSLGGNLALHAAVYAPYPERVVRCYAFNAPGFNHGYIAADKEKIRAVRPKLYAFQNEHDIVSSLLMNIAKPIVLASAFDPYEKGEPGVGELFYPHSNFAFQKEGGVFARSAGGKKDALCTAVNRFTRLFLLLPRSAKQTISNMILDAIYSSQPPEKQMVFLVERVTKYMVQSGMPELGGEGLAMSSCAYIARELLRSRGDGKVPVPAPPDGSRDDGAALAQAGLLLLRMVQYGCVGEECTV